MSRTKQRSRKQVKRNRDPDANNKTEPAPKRQKTQPEQSSTVDDSEEFVDIITTNTTDDGQPKSSRPRFRSRGRKKHAKYGEAEEDSSRKDLQTTQPDSRPVSDTFDTSIAGMNNQLLADHFAKSIKRHYRDSTSLELEEKYLSSKAFVDTSAFDGPHHLHYLPQYLEQYGGGRGNLTKNVELASPHTIIVCASGIRAADVTRAVRAFRTDDSAIAKLFAKHLKLQESIDYVRKTKFGFGVGTPARLRDLLDAQALSLGSLERIVIDGSHLDEKQSSIFTNKQLFAPLLDLLNMDEIRSRYGDSEHAIRLVGF